MRRRISLYIDGQLADLKDEALVLMDYAVSDVQKPTAVKNTYSKQITLPGTPANDNIFSQSFRLDRDVTGADFNPLVRTPFTIYADTGEILQSGYLKLDRVERSKGTHSYAVSLYGGLGSLLYGLTYDTDGNKLSLASLYYDVVDTDFYFTINKAAVAAAWAKIYSGTGDALWNIINFAPCYNGLPPNINADKARLQSNYETIVTLSRKYNEWETRDLRAQLQRPAIRVRKVFEAIQNMATSLGKTLTLDASFFKDGNPYYDKGWMLLPLLTTYTDATAGQVGDPSAARNSEDVEAVCDNLESNTIALLGDTFSTDANDEIDFSGFDASLFLKGSLTVMIQAQQSDGQPFIDTRFLGLFDSGTNTWTGTLVGFQVVVYDDNGELARTRPYIMGGFTSDSDPRLVAILTQLGGDGQYYIGSSQIGSGGDSYYFEFPNIPIAASDSVYFLLEVATASDDASTGSSTFRLYDHGSADDPTYDEGTIHCIVTDGEFTLQRPAGVSTGTTITKKMLLADTVSPAEFLLSYCKQFGLQIVETEPDHISILTRNTFYNGGTVDLSTRIDRKGMKVTPLVFTKKWQRLGLTVPESLKAKDYAGTYGRTFGDINLDTGTEFNAEKEELLDNSAFKGGVFGKWASPLLYDYYNGANFINPALLGGYEWGGTKIYPTYTTRTAINSDNPGYDLTGKVFGFNQEDGDQKAVEIAGTLVFFNGVVLNPGKWWLSDNYVPTGDNTDVCWQIVTANDTYSEAVTVLPVFSRYTNDASGNVLRSFDFGTPAEIYDPALTITPASSIYTRFWEALCRDRFNKSSKMLTAKVDLRGFQAGPGLLRQFYYYGGGWWVLNKVTNYSLTTWDPVECEFIQVRDRANYTNGQIID